MQILECSVNEKSLSGGGLVEARKQLSNHLEEDIQLLIKFKSDIADD